MKVKRVVTESDEVLDSFKGLDICQTSIPKPNQAETQKISDDHQVFIINDNRPTDLQTENNKEFLSNILTEFYKTIKDDKKPKYIKIRRLMFGNDSNNYSKDKPFKSDNMNKDMLLAKQKLKFSSKLQSERSNIKQKLFMNRRKFNESKADVDNDEEEVISDPLDNDLNQLKEKRFRPNILKHLKSKKVEEAKGSLKSNPPNVKQHMLEDEQISTMTINNKKVKLITIGGLPKTETKLIQNRLSSSEDDMEFFEVETHIKGMYPNSELNFINEEDHFSESDDSADSNRPDQD